MRVEVIYLLAVIQRVCITVKETTISYPDDLLSSSTKTYVTTVIIYRGIKRDTARSYIYI